MSGNTTARNGGLKGINIQFGIEANEPPKSPKVGGGAEWADIDQRSRLMTELERIQTKISQLARSQNASLTAKVDPNTSSESQMATPVSAGEETLVDLSSDSDFTDDDGANESMRKGDSTRKLKSKVTKSINEVLAKEAGELAREIRRRRKHPEEFVKSPQTVEKDTIQLAWKDFVKSSARLARLTWMYALAILILIVGIVL